MLLYILFIVLLVLIFLTVLKFLISDTVYFGFSREEVSSYECGFEQHSLSRVPLSIRYFLLTLVFLVFDLEVMLLLLTPMDVVFSLSKGLFVVISLTFIVVLFLGLIYEWTCGALEWVI